MIDLYQELLLLDSLPSSHGIIRRYNCSRLVEYNIRNPHRHTHIDDKSACPHSAGLGDSILEEAEEAPLTKYGRDIATTNDQDRTILKTIAKELNATTETYRFRSILEDYLPIELLLTAMHIFALPENQQDVLLGLLATKSSTLSWTEMLLLSETLAK